MERKSNHFLVVSIDSEHPGTLRISCACGNYETVAPTGSINTDRLQESLTEHVAEHNRRPEMVVLSDALTFLERKEIRNTVSGGMREVPEVERQVRLAVAWDLRTALDHFDRNPKWSFDSRPEVVKKGLFLAHIICGWERDLGGLVLSSYTPPRPIEQAEGQPSESRPMRCGDTGMRHPASALEPSASVRTGWLCSECGQELTADQVIEIRNNERY